LRSVLSMKLCPPKPGFTLISRITSTLSMTYSSTSSGSGRVEHQPGLAAFGLDELQRAVHMGGLASGWKVMMSAPALAKASASASTGCTIRCTSIGTACHRP
jgi:hypothetical protein